VVGVLGLVDLFCCGYEEYDFCDRGLITLAAPTIQTVNAVNFEFMPGV